MACIQLARAKSRPDRKSPARAGRSNPYIFVGTGGAIESPCRQPLSTIHAERRLQQPNSRTGRQYSRGSDGLPTPDATATAHSKLCGSTVTVDLKMDGDTVTDFAHDVKACALGQASSSIMARNVVGAKADELRSLRETVRRMLKENGAPPERQVGRHRRARAGARLQGAPCLDPADLRRGGRRDRPDRGQAAGGVGSRVRAPTKWRTGAYPAGRRGCHALLARAAVCATAILVDVGAPPRRRCSTARPKPPRLPRAIRPAAARSRLAGRPAAVLHHARNHHGVRGPREGARRRLSEVGLRRGTSPSGTRPRARATPSCSVSTGASGRASRRSRRRGESSGPRLFRSANAIGLAISVARAAGVPPSPATSSTLAGATPGRSRSNSASTVLSLMR